jgi:hypothetical protein
MCRNLFSSTDHPSTHSGNPTTIYSGNTPIAPFDNLAASNSSCIEGLLAPNLYAFTFHNSKGHDTRDCIALKDELERLARNKNMWAFVQKFIINYVWKSDDGHAK